MFIDLPPERRRYVLCACIVAVFTAAVEGTIVATAMPSIVAELGGFAFFGWVFAAFMLTQAVTIPIYGRLADLYGRKKIMFIGLAIFTVASACCGFSRSMISLVIFRALQGVGAGAIMPVTMTIIGDMYSPLERMRIQPYIATVFASSSIIGPVLGAFIVNHLGWPLIFWLNVPICLVATVMMAVFLHERPVVVKHTIDIGGALLLMFAISMLLLPLMQADSLRWRIVPMVAVSAVAFFLFLRQERNSPEPLLPVLLWRNPTILACNLGSFFMGSTLMGITAFLPTYMQGVMGMTVLAAGTSIAVMSLAWPAAAVLGTRLLLHTSYRTTAILGGLVYTIGSLVLPLAARLSHDMPIRLFGPWWPAAAAGLIGAGLGFCNSSFQVAVQEASGTASRGAATAAYTFMRLLGATFGTAILGAVLNLSVDVRLPGTRDPVQTLMDAERRTQISSDELQHLAGAVGGALHDVFWTAALIAAISLIAARLMPGGSRPGHRDTVRAPESVSA